MALPHIQVNIGNHVLFVAFWGWFVAQLMKVLLTWALTKKLDLSRLTGLGGMPSSHSSFLCAASMTIGFQVGFGSALFALATCVTLVVMTDAAGVRRHAGTHAAVLNRIIEDMIRDGKGLNEERLKELIGHTPLQVIAGALLGILVATVLR
ncbi:MAG: divergent PAP2 family protein [Oscillospiraceae bacterium]|nr:divergent PAP2 family protein [Oscillospiraceae bacterium]